MKPTLKYYNKNRKVNESELFDDELGLHIDSDKVLKEDDEPQDENGGQEPEPKASEEAMDEQQLRIESLKIAVKIAKLFDEVQPSDLIEMSDEVFKYVQHQSLTSGEWDPSYGLGDEENTDTEEETEETPAEEETGDEDAIENFDLDDLEAPDEEKSDAEKDKDEDKEKENADETSSEVPEEFFDFTV
jgi:hypothetical protein